MANYKLKEDAKADLHRIWLHGVRQFGEVQAEKYLMAFYERFEQIADDPYFYASVDYMREGYRKSVCGMESIYYRIQGDTVEIMSIMGRQDTKKLQS